MGRFELAAIVALVAVAALPVRARAEGPDLEASRAACRDALARGDQATARPICLRAFLMGGSPEDVYSRAKALVRGPVRPLMEEVVSASLMADGAVRVAPMQPWGYLARAEVAQRLGDRDMLDAAIADLRRVAPDHPLTKEAIARAEGRVSPWIWLGRLALGLAFAATIFHAARRRWRLREQAARLPVAAAAFLIVLGAASASSAAKAHAAAPPADVPAVEVTQAGDVGSIAIDPVHPDAAIPPKDKQLANPLAFGYLLQDLLARAEKASQHGDHAAAARFYAAVAKGVPSRAYAFTKICEELQAVGDRRRAIEACRTALYKEGVTITDYTAFVRLVLAAPPPLAPEARTELDKVLAHLAADPAGAATAERARCELALRVGDVGALEACTTALAKLAPSDSTTISFQWALALAKNDHGAAARLVERARQAGMASDGLAKMERATSDLGFRIALRTGVLAVGGALALLLVARAGRRLRAQRRRVAA
jgi:hypothetical protein